MGRKRVNQKPKNLSFLLWIHEQQNEPGSDPAGVGHGAIRDYLKETAYNVSKKIKAINRHAQIITGEKKGREVFYKVRWEGFPEQFICFFEEKTGRKLGAFMRVVGRQKKKRRVINLISSKEMTTFFKNYILKQNDASLEEAYILLKNALSYWNREYSRRIQTAHLLDEPLHLPKQPHKSIRQLMVFCDAVTRIESFREDFQQIKPF